jgi:hypothetical protein
MGLVMEHGEVDRTKRVIEALEAETNGRSGTSLFAASEVCQCLEDASIISRVFFQGTMRSHAELIALANLLLQARQARRT